LNGAKFRLVPDGPVDSEGAERPVKARPRFRTTTLIYRTYSDEHPRGRWI
jgi:hypothetical protein